MSLGSRARRGSVISIILLRSEEHTSELQSQSNLVCRLLLDKKNNADTHLLSTSPLIQKHPPSRTSHQRYFPRSGCRHPSRCQYVDHHHHRFPSLNIRKLLTP